MMITPSIMKIIYIVGSVIIGLSTLFLMFAGGSVATFFLGLIAGAFMLVFFRVTCELLILYFKMNDNMAQVKKNTDPK